MDKEGVFQVKNVNEGEAISLEQKAVFRQPSIT